MAPSMVDAASEERATRAEGATRAWGEQQEILELSEESHITRLIIDSPPASRSVSRAVSSSAVTPCGRALAARAPAASEPVATRGTPAAEPPLAPPLVGSAGRVSWSHHLRLSRRSDDETGPVQPPILRRISRAAAAATAPVIAEMAEWHPGRVLKAVLIFVQLLVVFFYASELHDVYLVAQANPAISQDTREEQLLLFPNVRAAHAPVRSSGAKRAPLQGIPCARRASAWAGAVSWRGARLDCGWAMYARSHAWRHDTRAALRWPRHAAVAALRRSRLLNACARGRAHAPRFCAEPLQPWGNPLCLAGTAHSCTHTPPRAARRVNAPPATHHASNQRIARRPPPAARCSPPAARRPSPAARLAPGGRVQRLCARRAARAAHVRTRGRDRAHDGVRRWC